MRKEKIKKQKGITLIALIITIIVLLILAGVSISVLTGKNGILTKAQEAKNETEAGRLKEENDLALIEELINSNISSTDGYNQTKGVNAPKISTGSAISTGLIPLNWNGSKWVVCSEDNWIYNYSQNGTKQWANAMASDGKYKKGEVLEGTEVEENELGSMFVWVPRYAYSINQYKTEKSAEGTTQGITNIEFLQGNTNKGSSGNTYATDYDVNSITTGSATPMIVHPAFNFGGANLKGIWVAKFEASMTEQNNNTTANNNVEDKTIKILPNAESWRYITQAKIFKNCLNMKNNNIYKFSSTTDTHQMKNSEWGAVTYLAVSQYGNTPTKNTSGSSYTENEIIKYRSFTGNGDYKTNVSQSTTGDITGIYDMNGGAWEYVASYYANKDTNISAYGGADIFPGDELDSKYSAYFDTYKTSDNEIINGQNAWNLKSTEGNKQQAKFAYERVQLMKNTKGDAMYEAIKEWSYYGRYPGETTGINEKGEQYTIPASYNSMNWFKATYDSNGNVTNTGETTVAYGISYYNNDFTLVGTYYRPFLLRGGAWSDGSFAGVFACYGYGNASSSIRFPSCGRVVALNLS